MCNPIDMDGEGGLKRSELARYALAFVARLPGIFVILSGMVESKHIVENRNTLATVDMQETEKDIKLYKQLAAAINNDRKIQCTSCQYCMRECPAHIAIPDILSLLNACHNTGIYDTTYIGRYMILYRGYVYQKGKASDCIKCGKCEAKCPQKLPIRSLMRQAARVFGDVGKNMNYYTTDRNTQILIYLLKAHGIKKIIISPGTVNIDFVYSVQQDGFFELYSVVDERSAAYMACGLAAETGEPVVLSCTGATASRNYVSALTEAFYRKLPILAITSSHFTGRVGHNVPQIIDRSTKQKDIAKFSVDIPTIHDGEEEWSCETKINQAILELKHRGGGPVHINIASSGRSDFSARRLPSARVIDRITLDDSMPQLPEGRIGIFVGSHKKWDDRLTQAVDDFCEIYDAVVLCDQTSNYRGNYGVLANLVLNQKEYALKLNDFDVLLHIGDVSGSYISPKAREVWRVSPDGEVCDTFCKLRYVFEMNEIHFFEKYQTNEKKGKSSTGLWKEWKKAYDQILEKIPELPFSNVWIAQMTSKKIPDKAVLHLGILNALRTWNFLRYQEM